MAQLVKGNVAVYKDLNLVTEKDISHVSTVKEYNYRSVAPASIRSFAAVRAVYLRIIMYWFSVLAGSVSTDQQEKKKEDRQGLGPGVS